MSTNFAETLVWKQDYDVKSWRHKQRTTSTNDYPMSLNETPTWKFSAYATDHDVWQRASTSNARLFAKKLHCIELQIKIVWNHAVRMHETLKHKCIHCIDMIIIPDSFVAWENFI